MSNGDNNLNTLLGAAIGGAIAIKVLDSADRPRRVTKIVYVKNGQRVPKKMKSRMRSRSVSSRGPLNLNVPRVFR